MKRTQPAASRSEFSSRLNSYSKTALATAALGSLATAADASAQAVVYNITTVSPPTQDGSTFSISIGATSVNFAVLGWYTGSGGLGGWSFNGADGWRQVGPGSAVNATPGQFTHAVGYFPGGYIGFKEVIAGVTYYGWLRFKDDHDTRNQLIPVDGTTNVLGAYAAGPILSGQVGVAVPEPAQIATGLGLLALGAAGVRELRRRRKAVA